MLTDYFFDFRVCNCYYRIFLILKNVIFEEKLNVFPEPKRNSGRKEDSFENVSGCRIVLESQP